MANSLVLYSPITYAMFDEVNVNIRGVLAVLQWHVSRSMTKHHERLTFGFVIWQHCQNHAIDREHTSTEDSVRSINSLFFEQNFPWSSSRTTIPKHM